MKMLEVRRKGHSLYCYDRLKNVHNIKIKKYQQIHWKINQNMMEEWKCSYFGKRFESPIIDEMWTICCYPMGYKQEIESPMGYFMGIFLQICSFPPTMNGIKT